MTEKTFEINISSLKKNWALIALAAIFILSFYLRTSNFHYDYLLNIDSYYQYRYMNFIVTDGDIPKIDYYMEVPDGKKTGVNLMVSNIYQYMGAYSFIFTRLFFPGIELWRFLVYFPALLASLMVIPAYYIGKTIYDKRAGIFMAFLIVFNPNIFMRSVGGDPDTDAIVMLMPLCVIALFLLSQKYSQEEKWPGKKSLLFAAISGIFMAGFAATWVGYWYIFFLLVGIVGMKIIIDAAIAMTKKENIIISLKSNVPIFSILAVFAIFFVLFSLPFFGIGIIPTTLGHPFEAMQLKTEESVFPNVYVSVQEMMSSGDIKEVVQKAGTYSFFLTFVICLPYLLISYFKTKKHMDTMLLIVLWSGGSLFATLVAVRFSILLAVPLCLGTAIVLAKAWRLALGEDKEIFE